MFGAIINQIMRLFVSKAIEFVAFTWIKKNWPGIKLRLVKINKYLDDLDKRNIERIKAVGQKFNRVDQVIWEGGSKRFTTKKRVGSPVLDKLNSWWYEFWKMLDRLDTNVFFAGVRIRQKLAGYGAKGKK